MIRYKGSKKKKKKKKGGVNNLGKHINEYYLSVVYLQLFVVTSQLLIYK